jgi:hypothetical protein
MHSCAHEERKDLRLKLYRGLVWVSCLCIALTICPEFPSSSSFVSFLHFIKEMTEMYSAAVKEGEEQVRNFQAMDLCRRDTSPVNMDLPG